MAHHSTDHCIRGMPYELTLIPTTNQSFQMKTHKGQKCFVPTTQYKGGNINPLSPKLNWVFCFTIPKLITKENVWAERLITICFEL